MSSQKELSEPKTKQGPNILTGPTSSSSRAPTLSVPANRDSIPRPGSRRLRWPPHPRRPAARAANAPSLLLFQATLRCSGPGRCAPAPRGRGTSHRGARQTVSGPRAKGPANSLTGVFHPHPASELQIAIVDSMINSCIHLHCRCCVSGHSC